MKHTATQPNKLWTTEYNNKRNLILLVMHGDHQCVFPQIAFSYRGSGGFDRGLVFVSQRRAAAGGASEGPDSLPYAILGDTYHQNG